MDTIEFVSLPNTPAILGLRFRRWHDVTDYQQMAAVREGSREWDRVDVLSAREDVPTTEDVAASFPEQEVRGSLDLLLAEIDNQVIGYNHVFWRWTEVTGVRVYLHLGYLLPHWRGKGIGSCLLHWAQQRIQTIAAADQPSGQTTFATNVSTTEREADALMQHEQYTAVRRLSDMVLQPVTQLPLVALPPAVTLRVFESSQERAIYRAWKDAFADMWTSKVESDADYQEFKADNFDVPTFDPALCHVAWVDDTVVGFVLSRIHKGVGMIPEVAVRKAWQRRGIARSLMIQALNTLQARGMAQVRLFTDADDGQGARSLYERVGFREVKQHMFYRKAFSFEIL
jgi:mycothiol synthase